MTNDGIRAAPTKRSCFAPLEKHRKGVEYNSDVRIWTTSSYIEDTTAAKCTVAAAGDKREPALDHPPYMRHGMQRLETPSYPGITPEQCN